MDREIDQFMNVTGESREVANRMLEACNGDVQLAISIHLESRGRSQNSDTSTQSHGGPSSNSDRSYEEIHGIRPPIPQTQGVLVEHSEPRRTFRRRNIPKSIFDPFQDYSSTTSATPNPIPGRSNSCKTEQLAELFKPPHDILFQGNFQEGRIAGQSKRKWLLVNLQDSDEFQCHTLNRDLWSNGKIKKIVKDHFIFLQLFRITDEGTTFRQRYGITSYPSIIIIDPRTGEKMAEWGNLTIREFTNKVQEFLVVNQLSDIPRNTQDSVYNKSEAAQLEAAIQASLEEVEAAEQQHAYFIISDDDSDVDCYEVSSGHSDYGMEVTGIQHDGVETNIDSGPESLRSNDRRTKRLREDLDEDHCSKLKQPKLDPADSLACNSPALTSNLYNKGSKKMLRESELDNPTSNSKKFRSCSNELKQSDEEKTSILVRFPDGKRIEQCFCASSPIQVLLQFLSEEGINLKEHEIITTFPRRLISALPVTTTFKDANLCPRQTLYVQLTD